MCGDVIWALTSNPSVVWRNGRFQMNDDDTNHHPFFKGKSWVGRLLPNSINNFLIWSLAGFLHYL